MSKLNSIILNALLCILPLVFSSTLQAQDTLGVARFVNNELFFPERTDEWIHMGSSLGSEYSDNPFDPGNPGTIGVVHMEPTAYRYFLDNGEYADGTMFLLSFYGAAAESSPQLPGFVQGELQAKEIHIIDSERFAEGRAFFLYSAEDTSANASTKMPDNSECFQCHMAEAQFNGTFTQFYPTIRNLINE